MHWYEQYIAYLNVQSINKIWTMKTMSRFQLHSAVYFVIYIYTYLCVVSFCSHSSRSIVTYKYLWLFLFSAFWYQKFICMIIGFPYLSIEGNLCWTLFQKMKYFKTRAFGSVYSILTLEKKHNNIIWYENVFEQGDFNVI